MPLVEIKGVGGYLSLEQKKELIRKVTDAVVSVEDEGLRPLTGVTIEDVEPGALGALLANRSPIQNGARGLHKLARLTQSEPTP